MNRQNKEQQYNRNQSQANRNQYQSRLNSGYPRGERSQQQSWNGTSFNNDDQIDRNARDDRSNQQTYGRDQYDNEQYYNTRSQNPNYSERYSNGRSSLDLNSSNDLYSDRNASDRNDFISQSDRFNTQNYGSRDYSNRNYANDYSARDYSSNTDSQDYGNENRNRFANTEQSRFTYGQGHSSTPTQNYSSRFDEMNRTGSFNSNRQDREFSGSNNAWGTSNNSSQNYGSGLHSGKGPKNYKRADTRIHEEVCDALAADSHIDASEIDVAVKDGVVTLTGTVSERSMKRWAEDCAEQIKGVTDVRNELSTQASSSSTSETDSESKTGSAASKSKTASTNKNFM